MLVVMGLSVLRQFGKIPARKRHLVSLELSLQRTSGVVVYYAFAPQGGGIKRCFCLTSVCLSVAYIGPNSRTERPRKTKIGTEVAHVTRDSDTTFKVKRSTCC